MDYMTEDQFAYAFNAVVKFVADMEYAAVLDERVDYFNRRASMEKTDSKVHPLRLAAKDHNRDAIKQRAKAWHDLSASLYKLQQEMTWRETQVRNKEAIETYAAQRRVERTKE